MVCDMSLINQMPAGRLAVCPVGWLMGSVAVGRAGEFLLYIHVIHDEEVEYVIADSWSVS